MKNRNGDDAIMRATQQKRTLAAWMSAALIGVPSLTAVAKPAPPAVVARVTQVERDVQKKAAGAARFRSVRVGDALRIGDALRTGKRSKVDLKFSDGSWLRLGQLSLVQISSAKEARLVGGSVLFSKLKPGRVVAGAAAAKIKG